MYLAVPPTAFSLRHLVFEEPAMKSQLLAASMLGLAVFVGCNAETTTGPNANNPAPAISPTATTVAFDVTKMT